MPPRFNPFGASRTLALRPRKSAVITFPNARQPLCRGYASDPSKDLPVSQSEEPIGPNMANSDHVSEEAAKMAKIQGKEGPDLEQGTPVQDILKEDKEAQKNAPQVLKDSLRAKQPSPKPGGRPFSTYARRRQDMQMEVSNSNDAFSAAFPPAEIQSSTLPMESGPGHKFPLPELPLAEDMHKDYRYGKVVDHVTNLLMRDGKLGVAQSNMSRILQHLRTASPPTYNPARPLIPGHPPASHLPLDPVTYLTVALDSIAPLLRIRSIPGAAGGGAALPVPSPLSRQQRRRQAFTWVLDAATKRKSRGSGRGMLAQRVAEELISIVEGRSAIWDKRTNVHKIATAARINIILRSRKKK